MCFNCDWKKFKFLFFLLECFRCRKLSAYPLGHGVSFITAISHRATRHNEPRRVKNRGTTISILHFTISERRPGSPFAFATRNNERAPRADSVRLSFSNFHRAHPTRSHRPSIRIRSPGKSWLRYRPRHTVCAAVPRGSHARSDIDICRSLVRAHSVSPRDYVLCQTLALAWPRISAGPTGQRTRGVS